MTLPYSREQEYEADFIGLNILAQAGYSPRVAIKFFENLNKLPKNQSFEFLSTHPLTSKRIAALKRNIYKSLILYQRSPIKRNKGRIYPKQNTQDIKKLLLQ